VYRLLYAVCAGAVITVSVGQVTASTLDEELELRLKDWHAAAFRCDQKNNFPTHPQTWRQFPSKELPKEPRNKQPTGCDDRDASLFAGLLCLSGEKEACESVAQSQTANGRWWRSPRFALETPREQNSVSPSDVANYLWLVRQLSNPKAEAKSAAKEKPPTTFSGDAADGVAAYLLSTPHGADALRAWIKWINENDRCSTSCGWLGRGAPRWCGQDNCVFGISDCAKLVVLGRELRVDVPFCDGGLRPILHRTVVDRQLATIETKIKNAPKPTPPMPLGSYRMAIKQLRTLGDQARSLASAIDSINYKLELLGPSSRVSVISELLRHNNDANTKFHSIHNIMLWILLLEKINQSDARLHTIAVARAQANPHNPFFEYVAHRKSTNGGEHLLKLILKACPATKYEETDPKRDRTQWTWERAADDPVWNSTDHSMLWDCVFIAKLWKDDPIPANYSPNETIPKDVLEKVIALKELMRVIIATGDSLLFFTDPSNSMTYPLKQIADVIKSEAKVREKVEATARRALAEAVKNPLGTKPCTGAECVKPRLIPKIPILSKPLNPLQ
jgi:hypothetical protein